MIAFRDIKTEMREACAAISQPHAEPGEVARVARGTQTEDARHVLDGPIEPWMEEAFAALVTASVMREPFMLLPCTVNGEATAAIVHVSHVDDQRRTHVTPLFVGMTPGMVLIDAKGRRAGGNGEEGAGSIDTAEAPAPG